MCWASATARPSQGQSLQAALAEGVEPWQALDQARVWGSAPQNRRWNPTAARLRRGQGSGPTCHGVGSQRLLMSWGGPKPPSRFSLDPSPPHGKWRLRSLCVDLDGEVTPPPVGIGPWQSLGQAGKWGPNLCNWGQGPRGSQAKKGQDRGYPWWLQWPMCQTGVWGSKAPRKRQDCGSCYAETESGVLGHSGRGWGPDSHQVKLECGTQASKQEEGPWWLPD